MADRKCPLCNQPVSEQLFAKITGIWRVRDEQEKEFRDKKSKLDKKMLVQQAAFDKERASILRKSQVELKKAIAAKTKSLSADNSKLKAEIRKATLESAAKMKAALKDVNKRHDSDRAAMAKQVKELRRDLKTQRVESDKRTLRAVSEARIAAKLAAEKSLRVNLEAAAKKQVEKATKEVEVRAKRETKVLSLALRSAKTQMSSVVQNNQKQQVKIENLERQLASKTTPQHEGLADEKTLMAALQKEHPRDRFQNTGKGGDILQEVIEGGKIAGVIIYECKRVSHWSNGHVEQAAAARIQRKADFAVLVTNATKKGTTGFFIQKGVVVIHTGGALALASILRSNLVAVAQLKLNRAEKEKAVQVTMAYLQGSEFGNAMDVVIRKSLEMADDMKKEQREHLNAWAKRHEGLKTVYVSASGVQLRTRLALVGKEFTNEKVAIAPFPPAEE
jgi:hypothetical protein